MLFESPHAGFRFLARNESYKRHPVTGDVMETVPAIWCEFGKFGAAYEFTNPETGETMMGADIRGGSYDTDLEALEHDWDQDTKELVERGLLKWCQKRPDQLQHIERDIPAAPLPWPSFDDQDAEVVVATALATGLREQVLAYERENRARPYVLDALEQSAEDEPKEVLSETAKAAEMYGDAKKGVADPNLRTITV